MNAVDAQSVTPVDYTRLTRKQAEKVAGVSRATLARYVSDGRLSARKDAYGNNIYDAAELQRVFPTIFDLRRLETSGSSNRVSLSETDNDTGNEGVALATLTVEKRY